MDYEKIFLHLIIVDACDKTKMGTTVIMYETIVNPK